MSDLISRCELFNRLAAIPAPAEANDFKAKIYEIIQSMETADVAYICDREKCEHCDPRCDLTRDKEHAATTEKVVLLDGISRPQGEWIPCSERLPDEDGQYLVWAVIGIVPDHVDDPSTYQGITIAGYYGNAHPIKWFGHVEKVLAWMPLPEPWKGADDE